MSLVTVIYIIAGLLPAIFLMWYIYKNDKLEKEPIPLLRKLAFGGVLAAFLALFLEQVFSHVMSQINFPDESTMIICEAIMIGASEEASKLFFLKRNTWRSPAFNFRYDGIVYAVFVSLGFAAIENVLYVFQYGLGVARPAVFWLCRHIWRSVFSWDRSMAVRRLRRSTEEIPKRF